MGLRQRPMLLPLLLMLQQLLLMLRQLLPHHWRGRLLLRLRGLRLCS